MGRARRGRRGAHLGGPRWGLARKQKGDRAARFTASVAGQAEVGPARLAGQGKGALDGFWAGKRR